MLRIIGELILIIAGMALILLSIYDTQLRKNIIKMNVKDENAIKKYLKYSKISGTITGVIVLIVGLLTTVNLLDIKLTGIVVSFTYALSRLFEYKLEKNIKKSIRE